MFKEYERLLSEWVALGDLKKASYFSYKLGYIEGVVCPNCKKLVRDSVGVEWLMDNPHCLTCDHVYSEVKHE